MSNIPEGSQHPAVLAERRALQGSRDWLQLEGYGGAYSGSGEQVKQAMNNFHPLGWDGFKQSLRGLPLR